MRPSAVTMSDMPGPKVYSLWWGDKSGQQKQKGLITYTQSANQFNPTKHMFRSYLFNGTRRLASQAPYWIVPFAIGYGTYTWAKSVDHYQTSKAGHIAAMKAGGGEHHGH